MNTRVTWGTRVTRLLAGVLVAGLVGCGADTADEEQEGEEGLAKDPSPGSDLPADPDDDPCSPAPGTEPGDKLTPLPRMCAVAEAWEGSDAARQWAEGFHPVDPAVQLPDGGLRGEEDERAFEDGSVRALTPLPDDRAEGDIRWEGGETSPVTLLSAADAFGEMDSGIAGSSPRFYALEVTGVELGEMQMRTGRGAAQVPAWLFTIDGYDTPLRHAAVALPEPLAAPAGPVEDGSELDELLQGLDRLTSVSEDGRRITLGWLGGGCGPGMDFEVLETDESVVLAHWVVSEPPTDVGCTTEDEVQPDDVAACLAELLPLALSRESPGDRNSIDACTY